jgi:hypothetical protein
LEKRNQFLFKTAPAKESQVKINKSSLSLLLVIMFSAEMCVKKTTSSTEAVKMKMELAAQGDQFLVVITLLYFFMCEK